MASIKHKQDQINTFKTHLYTPILMPDEIWYGYLGRFVMLNSLKNEKIANQHLNEIVTQLIPNLENPPIVLKLACISKIELEVFLQHHTLISLVRTTNPKYFKPSSEIGVMQRQGRKLLKKEAFFCQDCIAKDLDRYGFAFWRRSHQLTGFDWCNEHGSTLYSVDVDNAMLNPPDLYLNNNNFNFCKTIRTPIENIYVRNFTELIKYFSNYSHTFDYKAIAQIFSKKATERNLRICNTGRRKTISDLLIEELPPTWRERHFPQLIKSNMEQYLYEFDGIVESNNGGKIINILLLAAFLFKNPNDAINEITQHTFVSKNVKKKPISEKKLINSYIKHHGTHKKVIEELKGGYGGLRCRLISLGCPPLGLLDLETRNALVEFYEGTPLIDILNREKINITSFLKIIQIRSPNVSKALKHH